MAGQILEKTAAEAATFKLPPLDLLFVVDDNGVRTGEMRIGDGLTSGGVAIDGVAGGVAGVTTWNNESGAVSAGLGDLNDVSTAGVATDDVLKYTGSGFAPGTLDITEISGIETAAATAGQTLLFNDATGDFEPGDIPAAPSDNLGNHLATEDLRMDANKITGALELNLSIDSSRWTIGRALGPGRMAIVRRNEANTADTFPLAIYAGFAELGNPNADGLILTAYGSSRQTDATGNNGGTTSTPVTNLCYFSAIGQLLKANPSDLSFGAFGDIDLDTTAPTSGDILYYDGTNFVPLAAGVDGSTLTMSGGVPTWVADAGPSQP